MPALIQPIFYEDGTLAQPRDYVRFHDYPEGIEGWLAWNPSDIVPWTDDFNVRHEGYPLVFIQDTPLGDPPIVYTNVNGMVTKLEDKDPPKGLVGDDGRLLFDVYMQQYRINKHSKVHGRKRGDGSSVGIFIPLPKHLARKFPSLHPKDASPSHVTFLHIGEILDPEVQNQAVEAIRGVARTWWPVIQASLGGLSEFEGEDGTIPHLQVMFDRDMVNLRLRIIEALRAKGIECSKTHNRYKPHVTLSYLPDGESYAGKTPKGRWRFDNFEIWGLPRVHKIPFGEDCAYKVMHAHIVSQRWR